MSTYRRLLVFLRPHTGRFVGNISANVVGAALDVAAFALLIPFLNVLFHTGMGVPQDKGWITKLLNWMIGAVLDESRPMQSLESVIFVIIALVALKNVFLWLGGQFGASLQ